MNDDLLCPRPGRASTHHTSNAPADPARLPTRQHAPLTHKPWTERTENTGPATLHEPIPGLTANPAPVDSLREELSTAFQPIPPSWDWLTTRQTQCSQPSIGPLDGLMECMSRIHRKR